MSLRLPLSVVFHFFCSHEHSDGLWKMPCYSIKTFYNVGNFIHNKMRKVLFNMTKLFCSKIRFKISVGFNLSLRLEIYISLFIFMNNFSIYLYQKNSTVLFQCQFINIYVNINIASLLRMKCSGSGSCSLPCLTFLQTLMCIGVGSFTIKFLL